MSFQDKNNSKVIVALDYNNKEDAILMANTLKPSLCKLKVGLELFVSCGPSIIKDLHTLGYKYALRYRERLVELFFLQRGSQPHGWCG